MVLPQQNPLFFSVLFFLLVPYLHLLLLYWSLFSPESSRLKFLEDTDFEFLQHWIKVSSAVLKFQTNPIQIGTPLRNSFLIND
ncbi:hypothetical protein ES332_A13G219200v1 [Gossypium tomentosum]|uniref:Uncharacterized protein n=1 Tax=Gossypium tomentosum TaxID=34277 RepID=A0A5D2MP69_GOSTO|nr:hypothetical protein ES332_A13G219200v1 [Gossypium tomentosum]TYH92935.1 hypothetical protein ES332_A13G219200v1 [Gossypium tomentosum]